MRTECKQVRFEFHQLSQRKVKARFDGGKITSDAGVLLLREVERGTGLIAGLAECFRDHRDARLIEHTVEELLGQRIYGLCLGYEDLNDHDQLRTDPMLAVAVNKADPLGERRRQASDRGKALAGRCTLNRLELTAPRSMSRSGTRRSRWTRTGSTAGWWMHSWRPTTRRPRRSCWIWMRPTTRSMASRKAGSFTVTTATTVISRCTSSRGSICCAPGCGVPISMGPRDRWRNWNGSSAGFGRAGRRSRSSSGPTRAFAGMTCSAGVKTITWIT